MARDPRIDDKIAQAAPFARPILEHWRALIHQVVPEVGEAIKWGMPHFTYKVRTSPAWPRSRRTARS